MTRPVTNANHAEPYTASRIAECETSYDLLRFGKEFARARGFEFFSVIKLPNSGEDRLSTLSIINNWPPELISTYDQLNLLGTSPVIEALKASTRPYLWSIANLAKDRSEPAEQILELFESFGFSKGVYLPTQEPLGQRGAVSFAGTRPLPEEAELMELGYVSNLLYERACAVKMQPNSSDQGLSSRERECLQWTSEGKTSGEIAAILKLSEHTVNHYLSAACQKLGAVNRTHAVSKALRAHIID